MIDEICPFGVCDGSGWILRDDDLAEPCDCRERMIGRALSRNTGTGIPKRFRGVSFDRAPIVDMDPEIVRVVRRYVEAVDGNLDAGRGLWFTGDVGTGKTTLAMLVSRAALDAGRSVAIYSLPRLLAEIRKTFDEGAQRSHLGLLERLAAVDLLHMDDVGAERTSDWVLEQLYSIVNARYEDERAMIITTNLDHAELREQIGERTVSRLIEICGDPLPLYGHDRRMDLRAS